jgi:ribonuclease HIII
MVLFSNVTKEQVFLLLKKGFTKEKIKTVYEELRFKKGDVTLILYKSGKLLLQGKNVETVADIIRKFKIGNENIPQHFRKESGVIIGSDESLKGDTFGGIVVAAVKADDIIRDKLQQLGVADSKTLSDNEVIAMAEKIKLLVSCEVKSLLPKEYNDHIRREGNVTDLLNKLHQRSAQDLHPGKHIVDKYPGCIVGEIAVEKADSKYLEVAAASVLARSAALMQLKYLSVEAGFSIPKGSTHVKLALHELHARNLPFRKFVKVDFRNVKEFLSDELKP